MPALEPDPGPVPAADAPRGTPTTEVTTVLELRAGEGEACELVLVHLPGNSEQKLGGSPCHLQAIFVEGTGQRAIAGSALVDLRTGAGEAIPGLPAGPNEISTAVQFDASGQVVGIFQGGAGEETWGEGPSWEFTVQTLYVLTDGAWVERRTMSSSASAPADANESKLFDVESTPSGARLSVYDASDGVSSVDDAALKAVLDGAASVDPPADAWYTAGPPPVVAWGEVYEGEGSAVQPPVLISIEAAWLRLPDLPGNFDAVQRRGDWLIARGADWALYDLRARTVALRGAEAAWFWPAGIPEPVAASPTPPPG